MASLQQMGSVDLEQEKLKLLSRLNEINQRQNLSQSVGGNQGGNQFANPSPAMQSVRQQQNRPVASVAGMGSSGETPLTSFLRKTQKAEPSSGAAAAGRSMLSANVPGAPRAASIFNESPANFDNPLLGGAGINPELARKLSARSLMARAGSGQHLRGGVQASSGGSGNATWGNGPNTTGSFKTSGILPKHASDNHLLRAGRGGGLVKSRSRQGNISRENLRYLKSVARNTSEDSLGHLLPVKRRPQSTGAKHKLGLSRSNPFLTSGNASGYGSSSNMNAMW